MPDLPSEPSLQQLRHQARDLQRAAKLLAGLGFDVNARGRSDVPAADPWQSSWSRCSSR
jgi:hypothetical protein